MGSTRLAYRGASGCRMFWGMVDLGDGNQVDPCHWDFAVFLSPFHDAQPWVTVDRDAFRTIIRNILADSSIASPLCKRSSPAELEPLLSRDLVFDRQTPSVTPLPVKPPKTAALVGGIQLGS